MFLFVFISTNLSHCLSPTAASEQGATDSRQNVKWNVQQEKQVGAEDAKLSKWFFNNFVSWFIRYLTFVWNNNNETLAREKIKWEQYKNFDEIKIIKYLFKFFRNKYLNILANEFAYLTRILLITKANWKRLKTANIYIKYAINTLHNNCCIN